MSTKSTPAKPASAGRIKHPRIAKSPAASTQRKRTSAPVAEPTGSKQSQLISLLETSEGCTISQMIDLTGWQAHYADAKIMPTDVGNTSCVVGIVAMESA